MIRTRVSKKYGKETELGTWQVLTPWSEYGREEKEQYRVKYEKYWEDYVKFHQVQPTYHRCEIKGKQTNKQNLFLNEMCTQNAGAGTAFRAVLVACSATCLRAP